MKARFLLTGALLASLAIASPGGAQAPASGSRQVLHDQHTDVIDVQYTDGNLWLQTRIGSPPYTYKQASEVIFQLKESAGLEVPDDAQYAFLGSPGATVWVAPEVQVDGLLFAGWDTESLSPGVFSGDAVQLELKAVNGPGRLEMFQTGPLGDPIRLFSSSDSAYRAHATPVHSHAHANWVFTALGRYELTFQAKATLAGGGQIASAPVTYTWFVGDTVTPAATTTQLTATPRSGQQMSLTASVQPQNAKGWIDFREGGTSLGHANVDNASATLTATLAAGTHQLTAHFIPQYDNDFAASVSPPVTVTVTGPSPTSSPSASANPSPSASLSSSAPPSPSTTAPAAPTTTTAACIPTTTTVPIIASGHVDVATRVVNGRTDIAVKDSTVAGTITWRDPDDVVLHLKPQAAVSVPSGGFDFLGPAGSTVWQIPQTERSGIIWLGWNTESVSDAVAWSLTKVSGPGRVAVYEYTSFGQPRVLLNSGDGLPDSYTIPAGTHAHGNWAFTKQGVYKLTFRQQAGSTSDTATVTVVVGDVDPRPHAKRTTGCGGLPRTGAPVMTAIWAGGTLLIAGALLMFVLRRRRSAA